MKNNINKKKKGDSNGMVPKKLIPDYNKSNNKKYLNLSIHNLNSCVGMAEWSTQSVDTRYPSGCVGSIPTPDAAFFSKKSIIKSNEGVSLI